MKKKIHAPLLLGLMILFMIVAIANLQLSSFSQNPAYSTPQLDEATENINDSAVKNEESGTSENSGSDQSDNGGNSTEVLDTDNENQVQQPQQLDTLSPSVLSVTPNYGTSGIPLSTTITAKFSEQIDVTTVNASNFKLQEGNNEVAGSVLLSQDETIAIFTPASSLSGSTIYTATISDAKDLAGNIMNFASPWSFTTEVQIVPPSQTPPPQQPSPSTPSNPGGGSNSGGGSSGGGVLGDIKTSPTEKDVLKDAAQYVEDEKLVDRILPIILSKMDKRQLAATVLPYLDLQISVRVGEGETKTAEGDTPLAITTKGSCSTDEILIGGGFQADGASIVYYNTVANGQWNVYAEHDPRSKPSYTSSNIASYPLCLKAEIIPKDPNAFS